MQFQDVFREERYYCNHFFRLLCEKLIESPRFSGLARVLEELGIEQKRDALYYLYARKWGASFASSAYGEGYLTARALRIILFTASVT